MSNETIGYTIPILASIGIFCIWLSIRNERHKAKYFCQHGVRDGGGYCAPCMEVTLRELDRQIKAEPERIVLEL